MKTPSRTFLRKSKDKYVEKYTLAEGLREDSLGGFARLSRNFPMRRVRDRLLATQMDNEPTFNHLTYRQRIRIFMYDKKHRFFIFFGLWFVFLATGNAFCFVLSSWERSLKRQRKSFVTNNYPDCIALKCAFETEYEPQKLSRRSTTLLSDKFIEVDRKLKKGFTNEVLQIGLNEPI